MLRRVSWTSAEKIESRSSRKNRHCGLERERLAQLLDHPRRRRMGGDVHVEHLAPIVLDDEQDVQEPKGHRRDDEEVHRCEDLAVVLEERLPGRAR